MKTARPRCSRGRAGDFSTQNRRLDLLIQLQVIARLDAGIQRAVRLLGLVFPFNLREVERDLVDRKKIAVSAATDLVAGNQQIAESDLEVFLLLLAGLAAGQDATLDVLAVGTRQHQLRRSLVDLHGEAKVIHADLAGAAAAAARVRTALGLAPAPRFQVNLILVLVVVRLTVNT